MTMPVLDAGAAAFTAADVRSCPLLLSACGAWLDEYCSPRPAVVAEVAGPGRCCTPTRTIRTAAATPPTQPTGAHRNERRSASGIVKLRGGVSIGRARMA